VTPEEERRFFAKVRLPNGTWKTTYPNRLDDLNDWLIGFLPGDRRLEIMDVAISSGVSTLEWTEHLAANRVLHTLVAGDLDTDALLASWGGWFALLLDASGREPLLLELGPLSLTIRSDRRLIRAVRPIATPILRAIAKRLQRRSVSLVSAELRVRPWVEVIRDDVTVPGRFSSRFDVIRVANLLQPAYFDTATLGKVVANLRDRLRNGGLLVICRTSEDGINHATIFRRSGDHLVSEGSINGGAEVRGLALGL
jgi:hypothetical protein